MVAEYDAAPEGTKRALLRREGLYSSHIIEWRKAMEAGLVAKKPGTTPKKTDADREVERLRRQNAKLSKELKRQRAAVEVMGKLHALLEDLSESAEPGLPSTPSSQARSST
jgi:transposase-like protein